ncbi:MAG: (2Fe-2S)-binding protein [Deltaproteobacteria bacterium]|nr:(2Fe-2S)-binding protein [Deltaproteobacteria bacterium]MCD6264972.1 (2Fe-2S)-binding protein [Deltaproteobacteria bacterium]
MINLTIDGREIQAEEGSTILQAARNNGIEIPTLCYHDELTASGACRLCSVEIKKGKRTRVVASCIYQVEEDLVVNTQSERVMNVRRLVLQLLMARCPTSEVIRELAEKLGVEPQERFQLDEDKGKCILCRQCVEVCEQVVGVSAIGFLNRGADKSVGTPFMEPSGVCIGCGACAYVCPTGHIKMEESENGNERVIWGKTFKMAACKVCGRYFAPQEQLEYIGKKTGVPLDKLYTCVNCR